jgi:PPK2 family polyphosphate:nucleotide phosphotransferase
MVEDGAAIDTLQDRLYAERQRALLVILQGTDTSGKDGTIRKVFNQTGPLGVAVTAFGRPSEEELAHDFLWRVHMACPRRGIIGIFNRSHYEDVLVGRVRGLAEPEAIEARYGQINAFEKMLVDNGTTILKFMLHISKEEQRERLQARLDKAESRWKFDPADLEDRKRWAEYQTAYEAILERCSTEWAPWHVIPADRKWARNAAVAAIVRSTLEAMDPQYPEPAWTPDQFSVE